MARLSDSRAIVPIYRVNRSSTAIGRLVCHSLTGSPDGRARPPRHLCTTGVVASLLASKLPYNSDVCNLGSSFQFASSELPPFQMVYAPNVQLFESSEPET